MTSDNVRLKISNFIDNSDVDKAFEELKIKDEKDFDVPLTDGCIYDVDVEVLAPFERGVNVSMLEFSANRSQSVNDFLLSIKNNNNNDNDNNKISFHDSTDNKNKSLIIIKKLEYRSGREINPSIQRTYITRLRKITVKVTRGEIRIIIDGIDHKKLSVSVDSYEFPRNIDSDCQIIIKNESASKAAYELIGTYRIVS